MVHAAPDATWEPVDEPAAPDNPEGYARITSMLRSTKARPDAAVGEQYKQGVPSSRRVNAESYLASQADCVPWHYRQSFVAQPAKLYVRKSATQCIVISRHHCLRA